MKLDEGLYATFYTPCSGKTLRWRYSSLYAYHFWQKSLPRLSAVQLHVGIRSPLREYIIPVPCVKHNNANLWLNTVNSKIMIVLCLQNKISTIYSHIQNTHVRYILAIKSVSVCSSWTSAGEQMRHVAYGLQTFLQTSMDSSVIGSIYSNSFSAPLMYS